MIVTAPQLDLRAIKARQQITWSSGNYARIANIILPIAERLCEAVDLRAGQRVLDVAAGNGNAALAAARCFCDVTALDYVPSLLEDGRRRAAAEGLSIDFHDGDSEDLPVADAGYDVVLSTVGVMFAPDQPKAAQELLRVCRSGGKIGLANWTPEGFLGALFRTIARHVPPPAGLASPMRWGDEDAVAELLGSGVTNLKTERRMFTLRFLSPQHFVYFFRTYYGPTFKTFEALDADGKERLAADTEALLREHNRSGDETLAVDSEYLEIVAMRR